MSDGSYNHEPTSVPDVAHLDPAARVDEMVDWFMSNYEDPAESMPFESAEGGYTYYLGGPYDARDELSNSFPEATDQEIDEAVERVEATGPSEWAPSGSRFYSDDHNENDSSDTGKDKPVFEEESLRTRLDLLAIQLDRIEHHVREIMVIGGISDRSSMIGHNNPPSGIDDPITLPMVMDSVRDVKAELAKDSIYDADVHKIETAERRFLVILQWISSKTSSLFKSALTAAFVFNAGNVDSYVNDHGVDFSHSLTTAVETIRIWSDCIKLPF